MKFYSLFPMVDELSYQHKHQVFLYIDRLNQKQQVRCLDVRLWSLSNIVHLCLNYRFGLAEIGSKIIKDLLLRITDLFLGLLEEDKWTLLLSVLTFVLYPPTRSLCYLFLWILGFLWVLLWSDNLLELIRLILALLSHQYLSIF